MRRTKHVEHTRPQSWCPACRWERMSEPERAAHREARRRATAAAWRRANPDRGVLRDLLTTGVVPGSCDRCGRADDTVAMIDYDAVRIIGWRCRACWRVARAEWRAAHRKAA